MMKCPACGLQHSVFDRNCPGCKLPQAVAWGLTIPGGRATQGPASPDRIAPQGRSSIGAALVGAGLMALLRCVVLLAGLVIGVVVLVVVGITGQLLSCGRARGF